MHAILIDERDSHLAQGTKIHVAVGVNMGQQAGGRCRPVRRSAAGCRHPSRCGAFRDGVGHHVDETALRLRT